jgi:glycosyltransferase involved in cell wall biosynthesis
VRIGIDGRSLTGPGRGVAVYLRQLLEAMADSHREDERVLLVPGRRPITLPAGCTARRTFAPSRVVHGAAALAGRPRLDRMLAPCDVVWAPAVAPLARSRTTPMVLTVHDLSFESGSADYSRYERLWHRAARPAALARDAARVITVSDTVNHEVSKRWSVPASRVVTVRSGPGRTMATAAGASPPLPAGYVLAVGALEPRKAPDLLVTAHARARAAGLRAPLVLAGDGPRRSALQATGATLLGRVPDEQLPALYAGALALVCASSDEGFGFTPLEALAQGTPAVVADLPVFRETLGDAALRFAPGDADALAAALVRIEREPQLRAQLAEDGTGAVARLSWQRAAEATRAVLAEAAEG